MGLQFRMKIAEGAPLVNSQRFLRSKQIGDPDGNLRSFKKGDHCSHISSGLHLKISKRTVIVKSFFYLDAQDFRSFNLSKISPHPPS